MALWLALAKRPDDSRRRTRRPRRTLPAVAAAVALALTATACGGNSGDTESSSSTKPVRQGGSITIPLPVESRALDPFVASYTATADGSRMAALYAR